MSDDTIIKNISLWIIKYANCTVSPHKQVSMEVMFLTDLFLPRENIVVRLSNDFTVLVFNFVYLLTYNILDFVPFTY